MTSSQPNHNPQQPPESDEPVIERWRCPNCGQQHFTACGQEPPDICAYCQDMTTWEHLPPVHLNGHYPHGNNAQDVS